MNVCALSGRLAAAPLPVGEGQTAVKFLLLTRYSYRKDGLREGTAMVPCILFDATKEQKEALLGKEHGNLRLELVGRILRSGFENAEGSRVYHTEVAVEPSGLIVHRVR